jgi:hypothetical protein
VQRRDELVDEHAPADARMPTAHPENLGLK